MLKTVTLAHDACDPSSWTHHEVEDVCAFLAKQWPKFPPNGRIYYQQVSSLTDITPHTLQDIEKLRQTDGPIIVLLDAEYVALPYIVAFVLAVAAFVLAPRPPPLPDLSPILKNTQASSPNNELAERTNRARPNGRIPDIFGRERSIPDLIALPYKIFENNREVEHAYMCVGRGDYECSDIRDGTTLCSNIPGVIVNIYGPYTSPNSGSPHTTIGGTIVAPVELVRRSNSINGQILRHPNAVIVTGDNSIRFRPPNIIELSSFAQSPFTVNFAEGDFINLTDSSLASGGTVEEQLWADVANDPQPGMAWFVLRIPTGQSLPVQYQVGEFVDIEFIDGLSTPPAGHANGTYEITAIEYRDYPVKQQTGFKRAIVYLDGGEATPPTGGSPGPLIGYFYTRYLKMTWTNPSSGFDLDGDGYEILSVSDTEITLNSPELISADWATLPTEGTPFISPTIEVDSQRWIGPFIMEDPGTQTILCNFVAQNGLYKDDGTNQSAVQVQLVVEVYAIDEDDELVGDPETFVAVLIGSQVTKESVCQTLRCDLNVIEGRCAVRARRETPTDTVFPGTVVDEVRWRDLYSLSPVDEEHFGNVTTVRTVTFASASALAVKQREFNLRAIRKVPLRVSGNTLTESLHASEDAADILVAICRDRYIGNRSLAELDIANFYDTMDAIEAHFGHVNVRKFCYTFDNDNLSFQETIQAVTAAIHCIAYRRGNVIKLSFEKETPDSTLLFNHRNKLPGTERRNIRFGPLDDSDGIEFVYTNRDNDTPVTIFLPEDYSAINPKKIEGIGVGNPLQAYFIAWRFWNRLQYQNIDTEFEATEEADIAIRNDRILVADSTRPNVQDGEVLAVDVLELTLSQDVDLTVFGGYFIFLQHSNGTVESIGITAGSASNKVVLDDPPALPLVTDSEKTVRTGYVIVGDNEQQQTAFLLQERMPNGNMTSTVRAINYDARYYAADLDYINDVIDENAYGDGGGFTGGSGSGFPTVLSLTIEADYLSGLDIEDLMTPEELDAWQAGFYSELSIDATEGAGGSPLGAMEFDSEGDMLTSIVPNEDTAPGLTGWTICFWIRFNTSEDPVARTVLVASQVSETFILQLDETFPLALNIGTNDGNAFTTEAPPYDEWIFVAITNDFVGDVLKWRWCTAAESSFDADRISTELEAVDLDPMDQMKIGNYWAGGFLPPNNNGSDVMILGSMALFRMWGSKLTDGELLAEKNSATIVKTATGLLSCPLSSATDFEDVLNSNDVVPSSNGSLTTDADGPVIGGAGGARTLVGAPALSIPIYRSNLNIAIDATFLELGGNGGDGGDGAKPTPTAATDGSPGGHAIHVTSATAKANVNLIITRGDDTLIIPGGGGGGGGDEGVGSLPTLEPGGGGGGGAGFDAFGDGGDGDDIDGEDGETYADEGEDAAGGVGGGKQLFSFGSDASVGKSQGGNGGALGKPGYPGAASTSHGATIDDDSICLLQTKSGAGALTLNGALVSGGVATFPGQRYIVVTITSFTSGDVIVLTGKDVNGETIIQTQQFQVGGGVSYFNIPLVEVSSASIDAAATLKIGTVEPLTEGGEAGKAVKRTNATGTTSVTGSGGTMIGQLD